MGREEKRGKGLKDYKNKQKTMNKLVVSPFLSVVALNVSGLNSQSKDSGWVDFQRLAHFVFKDAHAESEGWKKTLHTNVDKREQKWLYLDKINIKSRSVMKDKKGHYIMMGKGQFTRNG